MAEKKESKGRYSAILPLADDGVENIWVERLGGDRFRVLTIPFWAYNLSRDDIVECRPDEDGIGLFVERVLGKSGNRTVRVAFKGPQKINHPAAVALREDLRRRGLLFEVFSPRVISVNVPSEAEYKALLERLETIPSDAEMIWEDGDPNPGKAMDGGDVPGHETPGGSP